MTPGVVVVVNRGQVDRRLLHWVRTLPREVRLGTPTGNHIPHQRNVGAADDAGEFVLYVDSDSVMPYGALERLLAWNVEVVGGVVCERFPQWQVCAVATVDPPARADLRTLPRDGLVAVDALGTGCLLVHRSVFERLGPPWFRCGQIVPDLLLEDTEFCLRVKRELGVQPYLDAGLRVGHVVTGVVWPGRDGRPWVEWGGPHDAREPMEQVLALDAGVTVP